jgi:hypothetical protein
MASVIVKFASDEARQRFMTQAESSWPELVSRTHLARRRPDAIIDRVSEGEMPRLNNLVRSLGTVYEDVKFEPM